MNVHALLVIKMPSVESARISVEARLWPPESQLFYPRRQRADHKWNQIVNWDAEEFR
jgi:hypothetical protein